MSVATGDSPIETELALFVIQLLIIVILSRCLAYVFRYIKQPQVIAEIICGILLGPSVLGNIPGYAEHLFPAESLQILSVISNIGLIFFMFLIGVELDPAILKNNAKQSIIIAVSSMAFPFAFGAALSLFLITTADPQPPFASFLLFVGVAMSITAFPVLARILSENRLMTSKVGMLALSSAAVNDVIAWILLAATVSIARSSSPLGALYTFLMLFGFVGIMFFAVRPVLNKIAHKATENDAVKHRLIVLVLLLTLFSAWLTEIIGVDSIFGGFMMGIITPRENDFSIYICERIEDIVVILLLPLYFTFSGLRTNVGALHTGADWGVCILVIVVACIGKIGGTTAASRLLKNPWRESLTVGFLMNTKGLVELIVLNLGAGNWAAMRHFFFDISHTFVLMAIVTTMITSPSVHFLWTRWEKKRAATPSATAVAPDGKFSILMCVADRKMGLAMTILAAAFIPTTKSSRKRFKATAVHLNEVTDQPSTFMFTRAAKHHTTSFWPFIQERALLLSLPLKIVELASADVAEDISLLAKRKRVNLVLLGWNEPMFGLGGSKVRSVLENIDASVGVLVDRGIEITQGISNILMFYTGQSYQVDALKFCRSLSRHKGITITVISNLRPEQIPGVPEGYFRLSYSDQPMQDAIEESKKQNIPFDHFDWCITLYDVLGIAVSILLLHAKEESKSLEDEQTRLFLNIDDTPSNSARNSPESILRHQALMQAIAVQKGESVVELQPIQREDLKEELLSGAEDLGEEDDAEVVVDVRGADEASGGVIASHTVEFNMIKQFLQNEGGLADVPPFKNEVESGTVSPGGTNNNNSSGSRSRGGMSRSVSVHLPSPTLNNNVSEMMNTIETLRKSKSIPYNIEDHDKDV